MQKKINDKTYTFDSVVQVKVQQDKITLINKNDKKTLSTENIDSFSYKDYIEPRVDPASLWFRILFVSIMLLTIMFVNLDVLINIKEIIYLVMFIIIGVNVIYTLMIVVEALFDIRLARNLIAKLFSNKGLLITISNKNGNSLEFLTLESEKVKVLDLEKKIKSIKIFKKETINNQSPNLLDELKKLGELFDNGIITKEEFDVMKQDLLN